MRLIGIKPRHLVVALGAGNFQVVAQPHVDRELLGRLEVVLSESTEAVVLRTEVRRDLVLTPFAGVRNAGKEGGHGIAAARIRNWEVPYWSAISNPPGTPSWNQFIC